MFNKFKSIVWILILFVLAAVFLIVPVELSERGVISKNVDIAITIGGILFCLALSGYLYLKRK